MKATANSLKRKASPLSSSNLDKFLMSTGKQSAYVDLEASPALGKNKPPDLADLVPSEVKAKPKVQNKGTEKTQSKIPTATNGTNVEKFLNDVFDIMSPLFLSEVSKKLNVKQEELSSILDRRWL
ncbi:hypothetical protein GUJ93_ZPchr0006g42181 [Zizania palustris]|uniref:Uncharacterized protein n=1 Tax=Zizania palustris TaxID=103762 RepID=A0A8J5SSR1_ZIZPA|nr:hypothetical protein GUJ93_ZPchr0006g42181 [Zizania palustris]